MRFQLVDRIEYIEPERKIITTKALSLAEEYLGDHFPAFPVLPGVLMLEALTQSAAWLVRLSQGFSKSMVLLKKAQNVRYASFVTPGSILRCEVDVTALSGGAAKFKGIGFVDGRTAVTGKLELTSFNIADTHNLDGGRDEAIVEEMKQRFKVIHGPQALAAAEAAET